MNKSILTPDEVTVTQMALSGMIQDLEDALKSKRFKADAEKNMHDMLHHARKAHAIIGAVSNQIIQLDRYEEGDEREFIKPK